MELTVRAPSSRRLQRPGARDMRRYFSVVDGMEDELDDQRMIRFWPLAEVKPVQDECSELFSQDHVGAFV
jgi:hypothetical protein